MVLDFNQKHTEAVISSTDFTSHIHSIYLLASQMIFSKYEYESKIKW